MVVLSVNRLHHSVEVSPDASLLWVLRKQLSLTAAKYGRGIGALRIPETIRARLPT